MNRLPVPSVSHRGLRRRVGGVQSQRGLSQPSSKEIFLVGINDGSLLNKWHRGSFLFFIGGQSYLCVLGVT